METENDLWGQEVAGQKGTVQPGHRAPSEVGGGVRHGEGGLPEVHDLSEREGGRVKVHVVANGECVCFDATRNFYSFGRLLNQGSRTANIKMHTSLLIWGKWRVGFYALRDIEEGEELLYEYGRQPNMPDFMRIHKKVCEQ